ncbi:MAG: aminotransferase class III-fold pyridoxal phosphate-dependent enzyme, partial [Ilumatobacteraceae bacterium]
MNDARYHFIPHQGGEPTIVGGEGCWLHTADGRRILDAAGGAIVGNIGWGRREVADATYAAMVHGAYSVPIWPSEQRLLLRDRLVERWLPEGFTQVFFTSGGSESTDSALRLARNYQLGKGRPDRWKVVGRHPSYHGMTLGTIAVASHLTRQR